MIRALPFVGLAGFVPALLGVPAALFVTGAVMVTIGFVAGYVAAIREHHIRHDRPEVRP